MSQPQPTLAGFRVLIAEGEVSLVERLQTSLLARGAQVVGPAHSVRGAFCLLSQPFDLAILGLNLDGESILPFADTLKGMGIPFLFLTGYDAALLPPAYRNVPIWVKPYREEAVLERLALLSLEKTEALPPYGKKSA